MPRKYRRKRKRRKKRRALDENRIKMSLTGDLGTALEAEFGILRAAISPRSMSFTYTPDCQSPTGHANLTNFAKLKDLYDLYKTNWCKIKFTPRFDSAELFGASFIPQIHVAFDPDQSGCLNIKQVKANKTHRVYSPYKPFTYFIRIPKYTSMSVIQQPSDGPPVVPLILGSTPNGWENLQDEGAGSARNGIIAIMTEQSIVPVPTDGVILGEIEVEVCYTVKGRDDRNPTAYYGVTNSGTRVISDLAVSSLSHQQLKDAVPVMPQNGDGSHPF